MQILVLSDLHLTNIFNKSLYVNLKNIIEKHDQVIINGDFWDGFLVTFDEFVCSRWNIIFPILKNKQCIYIYGNHDKEGYSDERTQLFSNEVKTSHVIYMSELKIQIEHGHKLAPSFEDLFPHIFNNKISYIIGDYFTKTGTRIGGKYYLLLYQILNKKMKRSHLRKNTSEVLITGHSHYQEFDLKNKFINSGSVCDKYIQYTTIDTNNGRIENREVLI